MKLMKYVIPAVIVFPGFCLMIDWFFSVTTVYLELDRMTDAKYPQSHTISGVDSWLPDIYKTGDVSLSVDTTENNIDLLTEDFDLEDDIPSTGSAISLAEISSFFYRFRDTEIGAKCLVSRWGIFRRIETRYHVWGLILNHTLQGDSNKLGLMWDDNHRSAFVIFYAHPDLRNNDKRLLQTTAHELGHTFNLHHEDGSSPSIMAQGVTLPSLRFLTDTSKKHLKEHPAIYKYPGTGAFALVSSMHEELHEENITVDDKE